MVDIEATFVFIPVIRTYIQQALKTLYEKTPDLNFRVIVVDQTKDGCYDLVKDYADLIIRNPRRINLGFSKANNEGILHAMHWKSKYIVAANDDIEFLDPRWWTGIKEQFHVFPEMMAVCPASPIEPGFGWGLNEDGTWVPGNQAPSWGTQVGGNIYVKGRDGKPITLEKARTKEGYSELLSLRQGHIEGFAGWFVVFKRETIEKVGFYNEKFSPANAEDYDYVHRIYLAGGRASATMRSFVHHFWMSSKKAARTTDDIVPCTKPPFANVDSLYEFSPDGANSPIYPPRANQPFGNKRKLINPNIEIEDIR